MKREKIVRLYNVLNELQNEKLNRYAAIWVLKNISKISEEVNMIQKVATPSEKFMEFEKKRFAIILEHCDKDENNNPVLEKDQEGRQHFRMLNSLNREKNSNEIKKLIEEYKEVIEEQKKNEAELKVLLEEDIDIQELIKIDLKNLPDMISPKNLEVIEFLVNDELG
jgi:hypothetical protein